MGKHKHDNEIDWGTILPVLSVPGGGEPLILKDDVFEAKDSGRKYFIRERIPQLIEASLHEEVISHYNEAAKKFGESPKAVEVVKTIAVGLRKILYSSIPQNNAKSIVVDVGCGHGRFSLGLVKDHIVIGVDFCQQMLCLAQKNGLYPLLADGMKLPIQDASVDAVYTIEVIQLFEDPALILKEASRIVKPGGSIIVSTLNRNSLLRRLNRKIFPNNRTILRTPEDIVLMTKRLPVRLDHVSWLLGPTPVYKRSNRASWFLSSLASNIVLHFVCEK